ncbi:LppM family (lipo)protein [Butyrivibrio sp. AE2005]|uniref:LppM family (lipo)protein n=1 Tax=Butyrivibrio sp. AE2005 TaxID=1496722 RepID=UPI0012DF08C7|nr:hypothetical protein [Butyrivibrio sp. AE2005]
MKKLKVILLSLLSVLALSGCVRFETTMDVKLNGKMDVAICYAMVDMGDRDLEEILSEEQMEDYKEDGWDVEGYKDGGYSGYIIRKENVSANELSDISDEFKSLKLTRKGIKYSLEWDIFRDARDRDFSGDYRSYVKMSGAHMKLTVNLPAKARAHNATHVSRDGKTYEWDLLNFDDPDGIYLDFMLIDFKLVAAAAGLLLALIIVEVAIFKWLKNRKKSEKSGTSAGSKLLSSLKSLAPKGKGKKK